MYNFFPCSYFLSNPVQQLFNSIYIVLGIVSNPDDLGYMGGARDVAQWQSTC
jgi:hypothetical protein